MLAKPSVSVTSCSGLSLVPDPGHKTQEDLGWRSVLCCPFPKQPLPLCPFLAPGGCLLNARRAINVFPGRLRSPRRAPPPPARSGCPFPGVAEECSRGAGLSRPGAGSLRCARPCAPSDGSRGCAPHAACRESPFFSYFFFLFNIFSFLRHFSSPSCRERRQGGGREKYCLNSQSGASGAPCAWHLCSLCPKQRARTGARGRRGSRASVGRHNKVTKQRRGAGPAALPSQRTRG